MTRPIVAITGASGIIGTVLMGGLAHRYELRGFDLRPSPAGHDVALADLTDPDVAAASLAGAEVVLALATAAGEDASWEAVQSTNLPIVWNTFEAARVHGVRRVVLASSNRVTAGYEHDQPYRDVLAGRYEGHHPDDVHPIRHDDPVRPDGPYAVGKIVSEEVGRRYAVEHGLSVCCLRIGVVNEVGRPTNPRQQAMMLSHGDLLRLFERAIDAPAPTGFDCFYGVSNNRWRIWDLDHAAAELGFGPEDDAGEGATGEPMSSGAAWRDPAELLLSMVRDLDEQDSLETGNRLRHSLQTATLAEQAGARPDWIVAALCHDVGSGYLGRGHGRIAANLLRPYVGNDVAWTLAVHDDFIARSRRTARRHTHLRHLAHPHYRAARRFADEWDAPSVAGGPLPRPLEHFEPMLRRVVSTPRPGASRRRRALDVALRPLPPRLSGAIDRQARVAGAKLRR